MNFDDLMRISDVIPTSVSLPTIGNHLDESAAQRGVRYMGDTVAIGFDIQFHFLVLPEGALLEVFYVDAGVLHGDGLVAGGHLNRQPGGHIGLRWSFRRSRGRILCGDAETCR